VRAEEDRGGVTKRWIEGALSRAIRGTVKIGSLTLDLRRLEVRAENVTLEVPAPGAPPLRGTVRSARARIPWQAIPSLGGGRVRLSDVEIDAPVLDVDAAFLRAFRSEAGGATEVEIDRLRVSSGTLRYRDSLGPVAIDARGIEASASWDAYRRALVGELRTEGTLQQPPLARPLPLTVHSGFRLARRRIELFRVEASGAGASASLEANVLFGSPNVVHAEGMLRADLAEIRKLLDPGFPRMAGRFEGRVGADRGGGPLRVRGRGTAESVVFGPLAAKRATADVDVRPGRIDLARLDAEAYGGRLRGDVGVDLGERQRFRARLEGSGIDLRQIVALSGRALPVSSRGEVTLALEGEPARPATWEGRAEVDGTPFPAGPALLPTRARGDVVFHAGHLRLESFHADLASTSLDVRLDLDLSRPTPRGTLELTGSTRSAADTQAGTLLTLQSLGVSRIELLERPLAGSGPLALRAAIGAPAADLDFRTDLTSGAWDGQAFDRAALDLALRGSRLALRKLDVVHGGSSLRGSAALETGPLRIDEIDLAAEDVDASRILAYAGTAWDVAGRVSGSVRAVRGASGLDGSGFVRLARGSAYGESIEEATSPITLAGGVAILSEIRIRGPALEGEGSARIDLEARAADVEIARGVVRLADLAALRAREIDLEGEVDLRGNVRFDPAGPRGDLVLEGRGVRLIHGGGGFDQGELAELTGEIALAPEGLTIDVDGGEALPWALHGTIGWSEDLPADLDVRVDALPFTFQSGLEDPVRVWLTGTAKIVGPLARPAELSIHGTLDQGAIRIGTRELETEAPVAIVVEHERLSLGPLRLSGGGSTVEARLVYGLANGTIEGACRGEIDLGILSAAFPALNASGPILVDLEAGGTVEAPDVRGTIEVRSGRARLEGIRETLEEIEVVLRVTTREIRIESARAILGGGEVSGTGAVALEGGRVASYEGSLSGQSIVLTYPEGFRGVYDGSVEISGTAEEGSIRGSLHLLQGVYATNFDLLGLMRSQTRAQVGIEQSALPRNIFLDVDVQADSNVWIRNDDARVEGSVDLHLGGALVKPELTGRITLLEGGTVRFRDVEYEIESGTVDFVDRRRIDPIVDLRAKTEVQEYEVFLHVEGTADKFNYELTSDPPLSSQDIIALLLTGNTLEQITATGTGAGSAFSGDLAANYFAGVLTERLSKQVKESLGLERLQINPLLVQGQADPTTRVTVGKRVGDDVRVIYSIDLGTTERQIYQVEWQATRGFRLVLARDTTGGIGSDVRYSKRFGAPKPGAGAAEPARPVAAGGASASALRVSGVTVEGVPPAEESKLEGMVAIRPGDALSRARMFEGSQALRRRFVRDGRLESRVRTEILDTGPDEVEVVYTVDLGPKVAVVLEGVDGRLKRRLGARLDELWLESSFSRDPYEEGAQVLLSELRSRGYYAADVERQVSEDGAQKTVRYKVDAGAKVVVRKVTIEGDARIPEEDIRLQMETRPDSIFTRRLVIPADLDGDVEAITRLYQDRGMLEAKVEPPLVSLSLDGTEAEVALSIHEGPVYVVGAITVPEGLAEPPEVLRDASGLRTGDVFSPAKLLEAESALRTRLDALGFPEVRVEGVPRIAAGTVDVVFDIDEDGKKRVVAVEIQGLVRTKEKIVAREIGLAKGDLISRDKMLLTQHKLYRLGLFRSVRVDYVPAGGDDETGQILRVRIEEGSPFSATIGAGYDTEAGPRGILALSTDNLGGRDRDLGVEGRFSGIEQRIQLVAKEPRLFGRMIDAIGTYFIEHKEEVGFTVDRRSTAVRFEKKWNPVWTHYVRYNFQRVDLSDVEDLEALAEQKLENVRLGDLGGAVIRDRRDDPILATKGSFASIDVRLFDPAFFSDFSFWKVFFQASAIHTFRGGNTIAGAIRLGASKPYGSTLVVPLSERFFAGGQGTIRGFARDSVGPTLNGQPVGGEAVLLFNEEWRTPIWGRLKGVVFFDTGNVYARLQDLDLGDLRSALGVGLRYETPIGPLRVEYGHKLDRREGETAGELFLAISPAF
jgi:outer membrane protein insertion porin family